MSFKKFSSGQTAPGKDSPADKPAEPKTEPGQKPAEVAPAPKS